MNDDLRKQLQVLFFEARKVVDNQNPPRYKVQGKPNGESEGWVDYDGKKRDFHFVTYRDVVEGGLFRAKCLLNIKEDDLKIRDLKYPQKYINKFRLELFGKNRTYNLDGENFYPALNIKFSYDHPNSITYQLAIYRMVCENGMFVVYKELEKFRISPKDVFSIDDFSFWCCHNLLILVFKQLEFDFRILKRIKIDKSVGVKIVSEFFNKKPDNLDKEEKRIAKEVLKELQKERVHIYSYVDDYFEKLGDNMYAVFNSITDITSNYIPKKFLAGKNFDNSSYMAKTGQWFVDTVSHIKKRNNISFSYFDIKNVSLNEKTMNLQKSPLIEITDESQKYIPSILKFDVDLYLDEVF